MESRIFIDIDTDGNPQIRIELSAAERGDVRDKLISRFLFPVLYGQHEPSVVDVPLELGHKNQDGSAVAFIRPKQPEKWPSTDENIQIDEEVKVYVGTATYEGSICGGRTRADGVALFDIKVLAIPGQDVYFKMADVSPRFIKRKK